MFSSGLIKKKSTMEPAEMNGFSGTVLHPLDGFASCLLQAVTAKGGNAVISPTCLYQTLALVANITDGETKDQVVDALGGEQAMTAAVALTSRIVAPTYGCKNFRYTTGASLWLSNGLRKGLLLGRHSQLLKDVHVESVEMGSEQASAVMNKWLEENTGGMYSQAPKTSPEDRLVAMGAMYLRDSWENGFSYGEDHPFTLDDGTKINLDFMVRREECEVFERESALTIAKPLSSGCRMIVSMPSEGTTLSDYVESGEAWRNLKSLIEGVPTTELVDCELFMPKFEIATDELDIKGVVESLGITEIFQLDANFSPVTPDPLMVDAVIQGTRLKIDEDGLEGASYVMMCVAAGLPPMDPPKPRVVYIDRPFVVAVVSPVDAPLFVGVVRNPSGMSSAE